MSIHIHLHSARKVGRTKDADQPRNESGEFAASEMRRHAESKGWKQLHGGSSTVHQKGEGNFLHIHNSGQWSHEQEGRSYGGSYEPQTVGSGSGISSLKAHLR